MDTENRTTGLEQAVRLRREGRGEEARTMMLELLERQGESAMLLYELASTHDNLGLERAAVPYYERSLELGLGEPDRAEALLGLGSTYRVLGEYERAAEILRAAAAEYPERAELRVFQAMALHNLGRHAEAMNLLLTEIADHSSHEGVQSYHRAIRYYADKLDRVWDRDDPAED
ncbi:tetratricopeptide repeat protein [Saccharibacillus sp. CPCC 101409]|uniref:tetratricopeptide repeat protein n=1 Tax=Saccharibacillus sp. CPCC 101409 TaxID=3058041 RepID=UPI00267171ED|nr:tetratricopeptide repeat protein [Saccharibacillus sp. CPCC 101409]MDO3411159.1 tetratricopeptide repeat protein [Saccharibacillus sp. CPCC 101409]